MSNLTSKTKVVRQKQIMFNKLDDEVVMMSAQKGEYYGLDSIGSRIWEIIQEPIEISQIVKILLDEYDISEEQCTTDVTAFLNELLNKELIAISDV
jgi:hypothetical protein